ncbi:DUF4265 domain-containing protein [Streptomyces sp. NL15-2K]|uniref:DUF4265 domain-containing protein n=1 Tax=Streptomyces sp. NL15-2K TaxID=376149 RepID=UPI00155A7462|nr:MULTISPECIES: DUF4265 domain-containing protein [Actinomycetes]WKX09794.1 DUF4265 domain-containing protein [Kutzneria buriramensis]
MSKTYIVHDDPAILSDRQRIAMVDLAPFGFPDQLEQIWLGHRDDGLFVMQCIPFRIYGLSLFDVVRIDENDTLTEVVSSGGHRTMRALIVPGLTDAEVVALADRVNSLAQREGFGREWSGDRHVAVNIPEGGDPGPLVALMSEQRAAGKLFWEWSDMKPFRTAGV